MTTRRRTPLRRADAHLIWLRAQYKTDTCWRPEGPLTSPQLGALTGTDYKALEAIDRLWALYGSHGGENVIKAIALTALQMQPSTRVLAREVIPHSCDWGHRAQWWPKVEAAMREFMSFRERAEAAFGTDDPQSVVGRRVLIETQDGKVTSIKPLTDD